MKVTLEFEVSNYDELFAAVLTWAASASNPPAEPPADPPPVDPPPPPTPGDVWQTTNPQGPNYWPPIFGAPPDMSPSAYFAAGYQVPFRPSDPPVTPPVPPVEPPPSTGDGLPADLVLGWKYRTIAWCRERGVGSFYRWEEPMCALQQLMYDIKTSGKALGPVLHDFQIDGSPLEWYAPLDDEPFEMFLHRAWEAAYRGDVSRLYRQQYGEAAMMGGKPLWQYMMENKERGFSPAVWDDYGRGSRRAYSSYWNGNAYFGPFDTSAGMVGIGDPWYPLIKAKWGIA